MADNGVSLPTALSQVDNLAKVQIKAQQTHHPTGPLAEQLDQSPTKVERVQKPDQAEKGRIQPDERRQRGRREARDGGTPEDEPQAEPTDATPGDTAPEAGGADEADRIGLHVDTKV